MSDTDLEQGPQAAPRLVDSTTMLTGRFSSDTDSFHGREDVTERWDGGEPTVQCFEIVAQRRMANPQ